LGMGRSFFDSRELPVAGVVLRPPGSIRKQVDTWKYWKRLGAVGYLAVSATAPKTA